MGKWISISIPIAIPFPIKIMAVLRGDTMLSQPGCIFEINQPEGGNYEYSKTHN